MMKLSKVKKESTTRLWCLFMIAEIITEADSIEDDEVMSVFELYDFEPDQEIIIKDLIDRCTSKWIDRKEFDFVKLMKLFVDEKAKLNHLIFAEQILSENFCNPDLNYYEFKNEQKLEQGK